MWQLDSPAHLMRALILIAALLVGSSLGERGTVPRTVLLRLRRACNYISSNTNHVLMFSADWLKVCMWSKGRHSLKDNSNNNTNWSIVEEWQMHYSDLSASCMCSKFMKIEFYTCACIRICILHMWDTFEVYYILVHGYLFILMMHSPFCYVSRHHYSYLYGFQRKLVKYIKYTKSPCILSIFVAWFGWRSTNKYPWTNM